MLHGGWSIIKGAPLANCIEISLSVDSVAFAAMTTQDANGRSNLALQLDADDQGRKHIFTAQQLAKIEERNRQARRQGEYVLFFK
jgi:hypothetical protein